MSLVSTLKTLLGSAWHVQGNAAMDALLPVTDGVAEASKVVVLDANKKIDVLDITTLKVGGVQQTALADAQYSTAALQSAAIPAANMAGAKVVAFENTGTTPANLTTDTAAAIVAAIANAKVGQAYLLKVRNSSGSANTATILAGSGVTLHGTMTIAQNVTRDFLVVLTSLTAVDIYSLGISAAGA